MTYEEYLELEKEEQKEFLDNLDEDEEEEFLESILEYLDDYGITSGKVYEDSCCYFAVSGDGIYEISNDAGYNPRRSWFPAIVTGNSAEVSNAVSEIDAKFDHDVLYDLQEKIDEYFGGDEYDDDDLIDAFEEEIEDLEDDLDEDEPDEDDVETIESLKEQLELVERLADEVDDNDLFGSICNFFAAWELEDAGLSEGSLYYEWEGDYIEFYDNIMEVGEEGGYYSGNETCDWIRILMNIKTYEVTADPVKNNSKGRTKERIKIVIDFSE